MKLLNGLISFIVTFSFLVFPCFRVQAMTSDHVAAPSKQFGPQQEEIEAKSTPAEFKAGSYKSSIRIDISNCGDAWIDKDIEFEDGSMEALQRNGIMLNPVGKFVEKGDGCIFSGEITVPDSHVSSQYKVKFRPASVSASSPTSMPSPVIWRVTTITIVAANYIPQGPIPPGLDPQVDIMWAVVPKDIVNDNFGPSIAKRFYCLEVVIGNNAGYDLQVATVGFKLGPTGPQATAMAKMQRALADRQQQDWADARTEMNAKIAGCNGETKCAKAAAEAFIRLLEEQNSNSVAIAQQMAKAGTDYSRLAFPGTVPVSSYQIARGTASHGLFWNFRDLGLNIAKAAGPVLSGLTFLFSLPKQGRYVNWVNLFSNPLVGGFEAAFPDETIPRLQRLDDQTLRDGTIIPNNRQIRTRTFIPKRLLGLEKPYIDDPMVISQALGTMVLVGDLIEFRNRISVTSNPSGEVGPPPTVASYEKDFELGSEEPISIYGANLSNARLTSGTDDIVIPDAAVVSSKSSLTARLKIERSAIPGPRTLALSTPNGSVNLQVNLIQPSPTIDASKGEATLKVYEQSTLIDTPLPGSEYLAELKGKFLRGARLIPIPGNEIKIDTTSYVYPDIDTLRVRITVPDDAKGNTNGYEFNLVDASGLVTPSSPVVKLKVAKRQKPSIGKVLWGLEKNDPAPTKNPIATVTYTYWIQGENLDKATVEVPDLQFTQDETASTYIKGTITIPPGTQKFVFKVKNIDHAGDPHEVTVSDQPAVVLSTPNPITLEIIPGKSVEFSISGSNLEGLSATLPDNVRDGGWSIMPVKLGNDFKTAKITIGTPATTESVDIEITFKNSNPTTVVLTVRMTPLPQ